MQCIVLATREREYTYLFLRSDFPFEDLPGELQRLFQNHRTVMELEVTEEMTLAQADPRTVRANLARDGFHLQLPPEEDESGWLDLPPKKP